MTEPPSVPGCDRTSTTRATVPAEYGREEAEECVVSDLPRRERRRRVQRGTL